MIPRDYPMGKWPPPPGMSMRLSNCLANDRCETWGDVLDHPDPARFRTAYGLGNKCAAELRALGIVIRDPWPNGRKQPKSVFRTGWLVTGVAQC